MSGFDIAEEIAAALAEAGEAVGDGPMMCTLKREVTTASAEDDGNQWDDEVEDEAANPTYDTFSVTALSGGVKTRYSKDGEGTLIPRTVRVLTLAANGEHPKMGDKIVLPDGEHDILMIHEEAPAGVPLSFEVEIAA